MLDFPLFLKGLQYLIFLCLRLCCIVRKILRFPMLCCCESQGTQHMISMQKLKFSSRPKPELRTLKWSPGAGAESTACNLLRLSVIFVILLLVHSNIALFKPASESSTWSGSNPASNAMDGNRNPYISKCTHTKLDNNPWWRVDLGRVEPVAEVNIVNRARLAMRLDGAEIRVGR